MPPGLSRAGLTLTLALAGCSAADPYLTPRFDFRPGYVAAPKAVPVLLSNTDWWQGLGDPVFDRLVEMTLLENPTLEAARARIVAAEAARRSIPGAALLSASGRAGAAGIEDGDTGSTGPDLAATAEIGLSWVLDPYGARRNQIKIAGAELESAAAGRGAAQLALLLQLGQAYAELRYRQRLLVLSQEELTTRQRTLNLMRRLGTAGEGTRLEVTRSEARVAELVSRLPAETAAVKGKLNQLAVLAGRAPGALPADLAAALERPAAQPRPRLSPKVGIPADLIRNRPDIAIAERAYYAAVHRVGVARAGLYPRLSLSGTISLDAVDGGAEYFLGPVVELPTIPDGSGKALVAQRQAEARAAHAQWKQSVLDAILEVEQALLDYRAAVTAADAANRAARLYREALRQTRVIFDRGEATLTDEIAAEEEVAQADRALAELNYRLAVGFVTLNVRLGAGHAIDAPPPPIR